MKLVWTKDEKKGGLKNARFDWGQVESAHFFGSTLQAATITRLVGNKAYIVYVYDWSKSPINPRKCRVDGTFESLTDAKKEAWKYLSYRRNVWPICLRDKP